jgi:hypothetical protein
MASAQDPGTALNGMLARETGERFKFKFEERTRYEFRENTNFGRSPDLHYLLTRIRIGAEFKVADWLKLSATGQDARAPGYGSPAPASARDSMDLHEAYVEFFPGKKGFGGIAGRQSFNLGEGRLIGVPEWRNTARTFDTARLYYRSDVARIEFLLVSSVDLKPDEFNRPRLGDRVWGMYTTWAHAIPKGTLDVYVLRHDQNRPGGFTLPGTLGVNTFGGHARGTLPFRLEYGGELAIQTGRTGVKEHRGLGWYGRVVRQFGIVNLSVEYNYASGDNGRNTGRETTFDQLYPANHDKFGHSDIFGWRNIHNVRPLAAVQITKHLTGNFMYDNWWLASRTDSLYDGQGRSIVRSASGTAGRHIGQEYDLFATYQASEHLRFGAGIAKVLPGEFLRNTTPHPNIVYFHFFQSYSF